MSRPDGPLLPSVDHRGSVGPGRGVPNVVIVGWVRKAIVLALKRDLCPKCGQLGSHAVLRATTWVDLFWIPVLPIWISHRLMCVGCGADRPLGWRQVRSALRT